jgi:hypothetical protein
MIAVECVKDVDCVKRGIYFKCQNAKCVESDHKICQSNDDCKKNLLHKVCISFILILIRKKKFIKFTIHFNNQLIILKKWLIKWLIKLLLNLQKCVDNHCTF